MEEESKQIDYKSLLEKYIKHVVEREGVDFISFGKRVERSRKTVDALTEVEIEELRRISDSIEF